MSMPRPGCSVLRSSLSPFTMLIGAPVGLARLMIEGRGVRGGQTQALSVLAFMLFIFASSARLAAVAKSALRFATELRKRRARPCLRIRYGLTQKIVARIARIVVAMFEPRDTYTGLKKDVNASESTQRTIADAAVAEDA